MTNEQQQPQWNNRLLDALPDATQQAIASRLKRVVLARGAVTAQAGAPLTHVHFPIDSVVAIIADTPSGKIAEVAVVGSEGYVEIDAPLGGDLAQRTSVCRLPGTAWQMPIDEFRMFLNEESFVRLIRQVTRARLFITEQSVLCNAHHTMDQRLARWLLIARDRSGRERFKVTQAEIAGVLGVRRAGISLTVARLRRAGAIANERGSLMVTDYGKLLEESCDCYGVMRDAAGLVLK